MRKAFQLLTAGAMAAIAVFAVTTTACSGGGTGGSDAGDGGACAKDPLSTECSCTKAQDCDPLHPENRFHWICTAAKRCVKICTKNADCPTGETCDDAVCRPPACGSDSECNANAGEQCLGGSCQAPVDAAKVASCTVLPGNALVHQGATKDFTVIARDASGATLPYRGAVTWSVDQAGSASIAGTSTTGTATGGATGGNVSVTAKIGDKTCDAATLVNYANPPSGKTRVVVADLLSHTPLQNATVVIGSKTATTDASGVALFDGATGAAKDVSVFHPTYSYVTVLGVTSDDLVIYAKPPPAAGRFTGSMTARSFDNLSDLKGTVHLALYGGSIPGNLIDIQLSTLLGKMVPTTLNLGSQNTTVPLPEGTIIGLGEQMFKTDYAVVAPVGVRTVWGLGGNADFSAITRALGPIMSGGDTSNLNVGGILTSLLPLLGKLQSGVVTGLNSQADKEVAIGDKMNLDTLLRIRATAQIPDLPTYTSGSETKHFDGAVVLGGALYSPQGLVPLGLTAGVDQAGGQDANGQPAGDGKIDSTDPDVPAGSLALRLAPLHGGLESSKYVTLALAASFSGLVSGATSGSSGSSGAASAPSDGLVLSGLISFPGELTTSQTNAKTITFGSGFLSVPNPTIQDRSFDLGSAVAGAAFHRLDIGGDATGEWSIYFPAADSATHFVIPTPPEGFDDRLTKTATGSTDLPQVIVQTVALGGGSGSLDYNGVVNFDSENMDDLTTRINAFSVRTASRVNNQ